MTTDIIRIKLFGQVGYIVRKIEAGQVVGVIGTYGTKQEAEAAQAGSRPI